MSSKSTLASIAVNRIGIGAKQGEIAEANKDIQKWLHSQFTPISFSQHIPSSAQVIQRMYRYAQQKKMLKKQASKDKNTPMMKLENSPRQLYQQITNDTLFQQIKGGNSVSWRLFDFFSNHFSVTASNQKMRSIAPTLEREAIAEHLFGHFEDMLLAVIQHPAMLLYLNNASSFGKNSKLGKRKGANINENLAREILELHTLGVEGGYVHQDILALANGITGWSISNIKKGDKPGFKFRSKGHEPGSQILLGKTYRQTDINQGKAMLIDLARHTSTATFVCTKLARHYTQDVPNTVFINDLVKVWKKTNGHIPTVMKALFEHPEVWIEQRRKLKTPREFVISGFRALNPTKNREKLILGALRELGQLPFSAGSPEGFSDVQSAWDGASALMIKIGLTSRLAKWVKPDIKKLISTVFGDGITEHSFNLITRAGSRQEALILLLMSPEFQRR